MVGPEGCCGAGVAGGEDGLTDVSQSAITESPHSQSQTPHIHGSRTKCLKVTSFFPQE